MFSADSQRLVTHLTVWRSHIHTQGYHTANAICAKLPQKHSVQLQRHQCSSSMTLLVMRTGSVGKWLVLINLCRWKLSWASFIWRKQDINVTNNSKNSSTWKHQSTASNLLHHHCGLVSLWWELLSDLLSSPSVRASHCRSLTLPAAHARVCQD